MNISHYDSQFCELLCFQDKLINTCNCSDIKTPKLRNESYCLSTIELNCLQNFTSYFKSVNTYKFCAQACPQKCYSLKYKLNSKSRAGFEIINFVRKLQSLNKTKKLFPEHDVTISRTIFGSTAVKITDRGLLNDAKQGYLKLSINYDSLYYRVINETEKVSSNDVFDFFGQQIGTQSKFD
jgi:hypothetical protein